MFRIANSKNTYDARSDRKMELDNSSINGLCTRREKEASAKKYPQSRIAQVLRKLRQADIEKARGK